jgi:hypothetical protein
MLRSQIFSNDSTTSPWGQGFDDAALANLATAALSDHGLQFPPQCGKGNQLPLHVRKMLASDHVHGFTGLFFLVGEVEQRPDLLDRKTEIAGATGEGKAADMGR